MRLPALADLLATAHVVALPLVTRFRGIEVREAVVFEGPEGWTEFSPFVEYDDVEASAWLEASIDFGWRQPPAAFRDEIRVNATVPAVDPDSVAAVLERFPGCRTAKVKVAASDQTLAQDVARVRAVREALGPEGRVRLDANGGWNVDEAEHAIHAMSEFDLEYVEQPLGGIRRALSIVGAAGLPVNVSSALDTSIGLAMGAHLAAAVPELEYDCGLGTASLLAADVTDEPLAPVDGSIPVRRVVPSPALLARHAADEDRAEWWIARLERCYEELAARELT